ncbi:MAG: hypothetical protein Q8L78_08455 [Coxiellaceae bacterium]|nr:hypothetical protein [Coxiellaceae bacterium]
MMFKQVLLLIILSVLAIMFQSQLMMVLKGFFYVHHQIASGLGLIFSYTKVGEIVQSVLALLLIPVVVAVLLAIAHFFLRQMHFPHTMSVVWVVWVVSLAAILAHSGHVTNQTAEELRAQSTQMAEGPAVGPAPQDAHGKGTEQAMTGPQDAQKNPQGNPQAAATALPTQPATV